MKNFIMIVATMLIGVACTGMPPIPDVPNPDIPVNVAPTKITLGE